MAAPDPSTTAPASAALVADTAFKPTVVSVGVYSVHATDRWYTHDGYEVIRSGRYKYWYRSGDGRWACQESLRDARAAIAWLRERGR